MFKCDPLMIIVFVTAHTSYFGRNKKKKKKMKCLQKKNRNKKNPWDAPSIFESEETHEA